MLRGISWESRPVRHRPPERGFKLSLPMTVEGPDPDGTFFHEETTLAFMSHQGALFPLKNQVPSTRGSSSSSRERSSTSTRTVGTDTSARWPSASSRGTSSRLTPYDGTSSPVTSARRPSL